MAKRVGTCFVNSSNYVNATFPTTHQLCCIDKQKRPGQTGPLNIVR